jgi:hypothetical protein
MRLLKQLFWVFLTLGILFGIIELFMFDIIKIDWVSFMEIQPSYRAMEDPLPPPSQSVPVEGASLKTPPRLMTLLWHAARNCSRSTVRCAMGRMALGADLLPRSSSNSSLPT